MRSASVVVFCVLLVSACTTEEAPAPAPAEEPAPPAAVTPAQFQSLRWLEGQWRGAGGGVEPFYERYQFLDDSTLRAVFYADSTLAVISDSSVIALRQGVLTSRGRTSVYNATEIDNDHVRFESPEVGRSFTWTRESDTSWTAHLTGTILGEVQEIDYRLVRIGP